MFEIHPLYTLVCNNHNGVFDLYCLRSGSMEMYVSRVSTFGQLCRRDAMFEFDLYTNKKGHATFVYLFSTPLEEAVAHRTSVDEDSSEQRKKVKEHGRGSEQAKRQNEAAHFFTTPPSSLHVVTT